MFASYTTGSWNQNFIFDPTQAERNRTRFLTGYNGFSRVRRFADGDVAPLRQSSAGSRRRFRRLLLDATGEYYFCARNTLTIFN